jgi:hypothetical protein
MHVLVPAFVVMTRYSDMLAWLFAVCGWNCIGWFEYCRSLSSVLFVRMLDIQSEVVLENSLSPPVHSFIWAYPTYSLLRLLKSQLFFVDDIP